MKTKKKSLKAFAAMMATFAAAFAGLLLTVWHPYLRLYLEGRQYPNAAAAQAALARDPNDAKAHFTLAIAAINKGDKAAAINIFKEAVAAAPDNEVYRLVYAPLLIRENPGEARRLATPVLASENPNMVAEARAMLRNLGVPIPAMPSPAPQPGMLP